jgi:Protein of unknown function (DUF2726)
MSPGFIWRSDMPLFESTTDLALLASALLLATLLPLLWARRRSHGVQPTEFDDQDTIQAWPPQAVRVLTLPERKACDLLRRALPRTHLVLAQVPLARFISVPTLRAHAEWLQKVGRLCPDLLICDASSRVIGVVEIIGAQENARSRKRHERMHRVLEAAGIPVYVWDDLNMPQVSEVRAQFMRRSAGEMAVQPELLGDHGQAMLPVPDIQEMLAAGDTNFANDPLQDPVASGFFDDLDMGGAHARA